jgi:hypothetical protein
MITASWIRRLADAHLYLYLHTISSTDYNSFQYLANYLTIGSRVCGIQHLCPMFHDLQFMLLLVATDEGFEKISINKRTIDVVL